MKRSFGGHIFVAAVLVGCSATDRLKDRNAKMQAGVDAASVEIEEQKKSIDAVSDGIAVAADQVRAADDSLERVEPADLKSEEALDVAQAHIEAALDTLVETEPKNEAVRSSNEKLESAAKTLSEGLRESQEDLEDVEDKESGFTAALKKGYFVLKMLLILLVLGAVSFLVIYFTPLIQPVMLIVGRVLGFFEGIIGKRQALAKVKTDAKIAVAEARAKKKVDALKVKKGVAGDG